MSAYRAGSVTLANAVGTGVADDKALYTYMPEIIQFYLGEAPLLKNVPTYRCREPDALKYVLDHLGELVVKEVNGSGGYGMLVGPHASQGRDRDLRGQAQARSRQFHRPADAGALDLPDLHGGRDRRPATSISAPSCSRAREETRVVPGGLTRVAMQEGSLVVNSSQGGGTKDTWIIEDTEAQP